MAKKAKAKSGDEVGLFARVPVGLKADLDAFVAAHYNGSLCSVVSAALRQFIDNGLAAADYDFRQRFQAARNPSSETGRDAGSAPGRSADVVPLVPKKGQGTDS